MGVTALSGLARYLDMARAAGLSESVRRHVGVRKGSMGWTDAQTVISLVLLNLAGGESVDDPRSGRGQALRILGKGRGSERVVVERTDPRSASQRAQSVEEEVARGAEPECAVSVSSVQIPVGVS